MRSCRARTGQGACGLVGQYLTSSLLPSPGPHDFPGQTGEQCPVMGPFFFARLGDVFPWLPFTSFFPCLDI